MRTLPIKDLHDYYDFNYNIEDRCDLVSKLILNGAYKTASPLIYRHEKKLGISRHLMIPSPSDAIVFQAIVNKISKKILSVNPTNKSFYTRTKSSKSLPHEIKSQDGYFDWSVQWKRYQEEIYKFSKENKFLVVTDLTNYFDSISLRDLRSVIASKLSASESFLDLLFNLIEQLSWNPDYLPVSLRGLPTINIDAPRLLAHVYLFEIDQILNEKTKGNFVRWMDDINFGIDDIEIGKQILGSISDVLKGRGLSLNLSKTQIYTSDEAQEHFSFDENILINNYYDAKGGLKINVNKDIATIERNFRLFLEKSDRRNWDKVVKRYYTLFARVRSARLLKYSESLFKKYPGLRDSILRYIRDIGFKKSTVDFLVKLISKTTYHDDIAQFLIVQTITDWKMPVNDLSRKFIKDVRKNLDKKNDSFSVYCFLWFASKYLSAKSIFDYVDQKSYIIKNDPFLCRQVSAIIPRIYPYNQNFCDEFLKDQIKSGFPDVASLATNLLFILKSEKKMASRFFLYLFPTKVQLSYPVPKYLILYAYICSAGLKIDKQFVGKVRKNINDQWYMKWIAEYFSEF